MNMVDRNRQIYQLHEVLRWSFREIAPKFGISPQRVHQIVKNAESHGIIDNKMEPTINYRLNGQPISATQAARETGIPYYMIADWVRRGLVKVLNHPGHAAPGKPVLLDPVTLQERIDRYRPRRNRVQV